MPEVTAIEAGRIIGCTDDTIRNYVKRGILPARRQGIKRTIYIDLTALAKFASDYEYRFDREVADQITGH